MARAIAAAATLDKVNVVMLAREHQVDRRTLSRRLKGSNSRTTQPATNRRLTDAQETALKSYIRDLELIGSSCTVLQLESASNFFLNKGRDLGDLDEEEGEPLAVGSTWTTRFLKQNTDVTLTKQYPIEEGRMAAETPENIRGFLEKLEKVIADVPDTDLWNMDASGFQIGCGGVRMVVTMDTEKKKKYLASNGNRELVTVTECINAAGTVIPPMLTISGKLFTAGLVRNNLHPLTLLTFSKSAFINDILVLQWFKHFERLTRGLARGSRQVLSMDGQTCHATAEVIELCNNSNITLISLPPHTTHLIQPLDVGIFQPYKSYHKKAVNEAADMGISYKKINFFAGLEGVRRQTFKKATIRGAWRKAGIWPHDPKKVLRHMARRSGMQVIIAPSPPHSIPSSPVLSAIPRPPPKTPTMLRQMQDMAQHLQRGGYEDREVSPSPAKMIKGALAIAFEKEQLLDELQRVKGYQAAAQKCIDNGGRRHIGKDSITVRQGRHIDADKLEEERLKAEKRAERYHAAAEKRAALAKLRRLKRPRLQLSGRL